MRRLLLSVAALTSFAVAAPVQAYTVKGIVECPDILEEHKNDNYRAMNHWWLFGYITGRNYADEADVSAGVDASEVYNIAYTFCAKNPDSDWDDAARHTYNHYRK